MRFYHAAPKETMMKIYAEGVLKKSWDGVVYMCKDPIDACKFGQACQTRIQLRLFFYRD